MAFWDMTSCLLLSSQSSAPKSETADSFELPDCERGTEQSEIPGSPGSGLDVRVILSLSYQLSRIYGNGETMAWKRAETPCKKKEEEDDDDYDDDNDND